MQNSLSFGTLCVSAVNDFHFGLFRRLHMLPEFTRYLMSRLKNLMKGLQKAGLFRCDCSRDSYLCFLSGLFLTIRLQIMILYPIHKSDC